MNVYKYRFGSKRDLDSLQQNYFYAPNSLELNDPYEGIFIDEILDATGLHHLFKNDFSRFYKEVKNYGIYSLSKTEKDELLWAYYANSHKGFCIEYDLEILLKIKSVNLNCIVQYDENLPKLNFSSVFHHNSISKLTKLILGTKSKRWLHEDEIRIIINHFGKVEYDARAVKAIYFGFKMPKTYLDLHENNMKLPNELSPVCQEQVMEAMKGRGIKYFQMKLKSNSYEFEYTEIEDLFKNTNTRIF
jgi:hypothetical protein